MSLIPPEKQEYTVLDLKDAFSSLPLAEVSQPIFVSKWTDPEGGYCRQLTGTRLLQGFKKFLRCCLMRLQMLTATLPSEVSQGKQIIKGHRGKAARVTDLGLQLVC